MKTPRFTDNRKPWVPAHHTNIMDTWIEHGFIPPSVEKLAKTLFNQDEAWKRLKEAIKNERD